MKNKTKTKPRVMWALYDDSGRDPIVSGNRSLIRRCEFRAGVKAIRVAVIPLDDTEAIVERAAKAVFKNVNTPSSDWDSVNAGCRDACRDCARAALTAAGIPCAKRKARK